MTVDRRSNRVPEYLAAACVVALAAGFAFAGISVFRVPGRSSVSIWRLILSDQTTLGFLRAAIVMACIYAIASAAALLVSGRWIRSMGSRGFEADPRVADEAMMKLRQRYEAVRNERDDLRRLLRVIERG